MAVLRGENPHKTALPARESKSRHKAAIWPATALKVARPTGLANELMQPERMQVIGLMRPERMRVIEQLVHGTRLAAGQMKHEMPQAIEPPGHATPQVNERVKHEVRPATEPLGLAMQPVIGQLMPAIEPEAAAVEVVAVLEADPEDSTEQALAPPAVVALPAWDREEAAAVPAVADGGDKSWQAAETDHRSAA